jgi:hypothetical protein
MKTTVAFLCLTFAATLVHAQMSPGAKPADSATVPAKVADPKAKAADPKAEAKDAKKEVKKEELPKIPGTVINRPNGNFLSLEVVGGNFKLSFYDKKHKLMTVDVTRATARWPNKRSATPSEFRTVLNGSGTALVGAKPVLPPFNFTVFLTLLDGEGDGAKAVETYQVAFGG